MRVKIQCPNADCRRTLIVDDELAGKKGKCSTCGSVFTIPAKGTAPKAEPGPAAGAPKKTTVKAPPRPADDEEEILDAEDVLAEEDDAPHPPPKKRPVAAVGPPAVKPRGKPQAKKSADDEFDDYEEYDGGGDDFAEDDDSAPRRRSKPALGTKQRWARVRVGMLIVAISTCVFAGGFGLKAVSELLLEIGVGNVLSLIGLVDEVKADVEEMRKQLDSLSPAERMSRAPEMMQKARELQERGRSRGESAESMLKAGGETFRVAQILLLAASVGIAAGCVFWVFAPSTKGAQGLAIAVLCVAATACVLVLIFQLPPLFSQSSVRKVTEPEGSDRVTILYKEGREGAGERFQGALGARAPLPFTPAEAPMGDKVFSLLIDLLFVAELVLIGLFLSAAARATKNRGHAESCLRVVWIAGAFGGVLLLFYLFVFIDWDSSSSAWSVYVTWLIHWIANVLLGVALFLLITNLFHSRRVTR